MELSASAAIVTGGAGGLGEAVVRELAAAGAGVVIADLADDKGEALASELGDKVDNVRTDVLDDAAAQAAITAAQELTTFSGWPPPPWRRTSLT